MTEDYSIVTDSESDEEEYQTMTEPPKTEVKIKDAGPLVGKVLQQSNQIVLGGAAKFVNRKLLGRMDLEIDADQMAGDLYDDAFIREFMIRKLGASISRIGENGIFVAKAAIIIAKNTHKIEHHEPEPEQVVDDDDDEMFST